MDQEVTESQSITKPCLIDFKELKATKTTDFILPLLGFSKNYYTPFLVNAYLGDQDIKGYDEGKLYVLLSNHKMNIQHAKIEDTIKSVPGFEDYYDILDSRFSMFVIKLEDKHLENYGHYLAGTYSKFSKEGIIQICKGRSETSSMPHIFLKDTILRKYWEDKLGATLPKDAEVWPKLTLSNEIFDKNTLLINS
jgi:hypothetical protein